MPAYAHLLRQSHLVRRLQAVPGQAIPFEELRRYLLEQTSVGDFGDYQLRTFQRDLPQIAESFGAIIRHRRGAGYYLAETDPLTDDQQRLLDAFELQEFLRLPRALGAFVQPETRRPQGLEHLRPLLRAAQAGQVVEFQYQKFREDAAETRTAGPLLLKEFGGRWYVLATMAWSGRLACFGPDRIRDLRLTEEKFTTPAGFDAATYYEHAFGITRPDDGQTPLEIVLRFTPQQGRYIVAYPLHSSQRVLLNNAQEIRLALTVFPTYELRTELLSYSPEVAVLAPFELHDWLHQQHAEAAALGSKAAAT